MTVWPVEQRTWSGDGGTWCQNHQKMAQEELDKDLACKVVLSLPKDCQFCRGLAGNFLLSFLAGASLVNHLRVAGVKNSVSSPALCEMGRTASPALPRPVHNLAISPTSPAFRGVTLSPALQRKSSQSTGGLQLQQQCVISPSNSVASNTSTSPGLSFSLSQTHSNSSRPSTPSSLVVKSKAISPGPGRPMIESSEFPSKTNHHRGLKRTRDNDEETMTGFEVVSQSFLLIETFICKELWLVNSCRESGREAVMGWIGLGWTNAAVIAT